MPSRWHRQRIRQAVEAATFKIDGALVGVAVSVGVTELIVGDSRFDQVYMNRPGFRSYSGVCWASKTSRSVCRG